MAIETMEGGGFIVTGAADIEAYRRLAIQKMMEIELLTGMKHSRGNPFKVAAQMLGWPPRTRKLTLYREYCGTFGLTPKPSLAA